MATTQSNVRQTPRKLPDGMVRRRNAYDAKFSSDARRILTKLRTDSGTTMNIHARSFPEDRRDAVAALPYGDGISETSGITRMTRQLETSTILTASVLPGVTITT